MNGTKDPDYDDDLPDDYDEWPDEDEDDEDDEDYDEERDGAWSEIEREFHDQFTSDDDDPSLLDHIRMSDLSRKAEEKLEDNYEAIFGLVEAHLENLGFDRFVTYFRAEGFDVRPDKDTDLDGWDHGARGPMFCRKIVQLPAVAPAYGETKEVESVCMALIMLGLQEEKSLDQLLMGIRDCTGLQALAQTEASAQKDETA